MAELVLELPLKVTITNTSNSIKTFIPYQETYLVNINAGNSVEIENISSAEAIYYLGQAMQGLTVTSEEIPYGRCPYVRYNPSTGEYKDNVSVILTCPDKDNKANIYYTTDGSTPDNTDLKYTKPLNITDTTILKTIAYEPLEYNLPSEVKTETYTILKKRTVIISDGSYITTTITSNGVPITNNSKVYDKAILNILTTSEVDYTITDFRINNENRFPATPNPISYTVNGENISIITKAIATANIISTNDVIHNIVFDTDLLPHIDHDSELGTTATLINVNDNFKLKLYLAATNGLQLVGSINGNDYILYNEADSGWKTDNITTYNAGLLAANDDIVTILSTNILATPSLYGWQTYAHK